MKMEEKAVSDSLFPDFKKNDLLILEIELLDYYGSSVGFQYFVNIQFRSRFFISLWPTML
jgi:hypothetical protein